MPRYVRRVPRWLSANIVAAVLCWGTPLSSAAAAAEDAAQVVAAEVRAQGHTCEEPVTATRDAAESTAEEVVWRLECANAAYRVRLVPGMGAEVKTLE